MIFLLRKLRQSLLAQGKTTRYLVYAIGEILLVVIGILIALQVNNWNQERQAAIKAKNYHQRIIEDLDIFISETENTINRAIYIRKLILQTNDMLEAKKLPEDKIQDFKSTLRLYYQLPYRYPAISTLTEMRSNGELELLENLDLRKKLILLEQEILSADEILLMMGHQATNHMFYVDQYVQYIPDTSIISTDRINTDIKANFEAMANDEKLINYLSRFSVQWSHHIMFSRDLNGSTIKLRDELKKKQENFNK